jgi:lipopolysaccharide transport system permease protein
VNQSLTSKGGDLENRGPNGTAVSERPLTVVRPPGRILTIDWAEIWHYRELLYFLAVRNIKVRYKQTAIGITWAVLQPVVSTVILSILFASFARFDTRDVPYPLFALSGLLIWLFSHLSITTASTSFVGNANLVTKVYFPRLIMPVASTLACVLDLLIGMAILAVLMIYYQVSMTWQIVLAPLFLILGVIFAAAVGTLFSALNVRFRDVQFALPFILQIWMLASPVFYPTTLLSEKWKLIFAMNPLTGILDGFRSALFGTAFEWEVIGISCSSLVVMTLFSLFVFRQMEDDFADMI